MKIIVAVGEASWIFLLIVSEGLVGCPGVTASQSENVSHLQNNLFAQTLRYAQNFILGISIICLW